jgi:hypothetical protein
MEWLGYVKSSIYMACNGMRFICIFLTYPVSLILVRRHRHQDLALT